MRATMLATLLWGISLPALAATGDPPPLAAEVEVAPREASVGDPLDVTLTVTLPPGARLLPQPFGPEIGAFTVLEGDWEPPPRERERSLQRIWRGRVAAYETGSLELPAFVIPVESADGTGVVRSAPTAIGIVSVLPPQEAGAEPLEIADLKGPASMKAEYRALRVAGLILLVLLLVSLLVWWLVRRYADRFAARPVPEDPFHRVPPHVWIYGELQRLLERRLAEEGKVQQFFDELSWILKRYLGGRYRLELMERTTSELLPLLKQAGAPPAPCQQARALLERCDLVKFARQAPQPEECRGAVEQTYRIVDATRVADESEAPAERGAA